MFFNKFCEGVVALEFVASEACDWPQRQKAVLCYWRFYQWDITFQEECVRIELKGIQLAELMEQIWRQSCSIGLWLSKTPIFLIYIFICSFFNTYFRPGVSTPANAAFRKQAREDCERSSPAWATEGGESLIFTRWKKKPLFFSFMQNTSRCWTSDWALSRYDTDSQAVTVSQVLPACFYTWLPGQSVQLCGILLELLSSWAFLFYRIDVSRTESQLHWHTQPQLVKTLLKTTFGNGCKRDHQRQQEWGHSKERGGSWNQDRWCYSPLLMT